MALEGRKKGPPRPPPGPGRSSPPPPQPGGGYDRYQPPAAAGPGGGPPRRPAPGAPPERERSPVRDPYDDRYRDPYGAPPPRHPPPPTESAAGRAPPPRGGARSEEFDRREDPYYPDPYRRPPPPDDPYYDRYRDDPYRRDPYRRDPYADPYRDPYYRDYPPYDAPPRKPPPPDCEIVLLNAQLRNYGEFVERKLKALTLVVSVVIIPEDRSIPQMIEDASKRNCLFAVVVNSQNETHQSLTVNILHGTPQEHRNMPVEDAMTLISRSFDTYIQKEREKTAPPPPPAPAPAPAARPPPPFIPPGPDIAYLLNLLADNRQVTIEELDKVINYLRERKEKLYESEGRRPPPAPAAEPTAYAAADQAKADPVNLQQEQQELQAKILSILNGPGDKSAPKAPLGQVRPGMPMGNGAQAQGVGQGGMSSLINFDNPSVQKALDNLIQSGPNLLKTISPQQAAAAHAVPQAQAELRRELPPATHHPGYGQAAQHPQAAHHPQAAQHPQHPQHQHLAPQGQPQGMQAQRPMYMNPQGGQARAPQMQPGARRPY